MEESRETWIGGDGGPLVVLQAGALSAWRGAADFEQSLMNGGTLETDYDVICDCESHHLHRHNRDMLVLDDSEWSGRIYVPEDGVIVVEQPYYTSEEHPDVMAQIRGLEPSFSFEFNIVDERLRLLVGADSADGSSYGVSEVRVTPGRRQCSVYRLENVLAIILRME